VEEAEVVRGPRVSTLAPLLEQRHRLRNPTVLLVEGAEVGRGVRESPAARHFQVLPGAAEVMENALRLVVAPAQQTMRFGMLRVELEHVAERADGILEPAAHVSDPRLDPRSVQEDLHGREARVEIAAEWAAPRTSQAPHLDHAALMQGRT